MHLAAIDIGSNAVRLIIANISDQGRMTEVEKVRAPIRLGAEAFGQGQISASTTQRLVSTFGDFRQRMQERGVNHCWAVATSAMRESANSKQICEQILKRTGIEIEVISGNREAQLIFSAIQKKVPLENKNVVLIDVGGGSVEVSVVQNNQLINGQTFPMGTVRLLERLKTKGFNEIHLNLLIGEHIDEIHQYLHAHLSNHQVDFCVGTGGNLECLSKLKTILLRKSQSHVVSSVDLELIIQKLRNTSIEDRCSILGLRRDRADVIVPALLSVQMVMRQAGAENIRIPFVGLRDGILWELFQTTDVQEDLNI